MESHCCLNSFVNSSYIDSVEISLYLPVNFIMRDEFFYIAKASFARPGPPLVTGSVRHASRAAGGAVKHLLHSHLSAGTGSL